MLNESTLTASSNILFFMINLSVISNFGIRRKYIMLILIPFRYCISLTECKQRKDRPKQMP